jgi:hypothetical protein
LHPRLRRVWRDTFANDQTVVLVRVDQLAETDLRPRQVSQQRWRVHQRDCATKAIGSCRVVFIAKCDIAFLRERTRRRSISRAGLVSERGVGERKRACAERKHQTKSSKKSGVPHSQDLVLERAERNSESTRMQANLALMAMGAPDLPPDCHLSS